MNRILVWDWPVRIGHWLLAGAFVLAWLTGDSETWRLVHVWAGGAVVGVVLFRLLWGLMGTRYARFASFVRGPGAVKAYLLGLFTQPRVEQPGHNPAGGWAIVALLALGLLTGVSGWLTYQEIGGEWFEELHETLASTMLAVVLLHLVGVLTGSLAHGENLVRAMFTGRKRGDADAAIAGARPLAVTLLLACAATCAWWLAR
jgi:cytochrome b